MTRAERALIELVTETRARLDSSELDALAKHRSFVPAFEARLRAQVFERVRRPSAALLAALERARSPLCELAATRTFDRFAHWSRYAMLARLLHALELGFDELRYALAAAGHEGACDCAVTRTLVAERRRPSSDRLHCEEVDDSDSVLLRERYVCGHCGCAWERCLSCYPGDPIGGESWAALR